MSENKHTPEPWFVNDKRKIGWMDNAIFLFSEKEGNVVRCYDDYGTAEANARRIVACVNACAGIPTDQLESGEARYVRNELADIYALEKRRDELLAALEKGGHSLREISLWDKTTAKDVAMAKAAYAEVKAAIASVKGYGQPEKSAKTEVPAIVFFPAGSLGEEIEEEGRPA